MPCRHGRELGRACRRGRRRRHGGLCGVFQSGWFVESMWSQTLVIHMLRSPRLPSLRDHAAPALCVLTVLAWRSSPGCRQAPSPMHWASCRCRRASSRCSSASSPPTSRSPSWQSAATSPATASCCNFTGTLVKDVWAAATRPRWPRRPKTAKNAPHPRFNFFCKFYFFCFLSLLLTRRPAGISCSRGCRFDEEASAVATDCPARDFPSANSNSTCLICFVN